MDSQRLRPSLHQVGDVGIRRVEPARVIGLGHDDRHAIVHPGERPGRGGRDDRARVEHLPLGRKPALVEAGEAERPAVRHADVQRLLAGRRRLPFIEAVDRNEAAVTRERVAKCGAGRERFAARVDHARADRRILREARHEAPAHLHELAPAVRADAHDRHLLHRRDVVARTDVGRVIEAERQRDRSGMAGELVAAAHGYSVSAISFTGAVSSRCAVFATCSVSQ